MTASAAPELRPLRTGELLDRAFRLYRQHFLTFVGIVALFLVPLTLLQTAFQSATAAASLNNVLNSPEDLTSSTAILVVLGVVIGVVVYLLQSSIPIAAVTRAVAGSYLGETVGALDSYRRVGRRWLSVVGANVLVLLLGGVFLIWLIIPCVGWLTGPGLLFYLSLVISPLVAPVIILERSRARGSLGRVWNLTRQRFWPVIGFVVILGLLNLIFVAGPAGLVSFLTTNLLVSPGSIVEGSVAATVTSNLVTLLVSLIFLPFQLTAITLLYFDLRVRLEGFDLAVLASESTGDTAEVEAVLATAPAVRSSGLVTGREIGYFAGLTLLFVVLYLGLVFLFLGLSGIFGPGF